MVYLIDIVLVKNLAINCPDQQQGYQDFDQTIDVVLLHQSDQPPDS